MRWFFLSLLLVVGMACDTTSTVATTPPTTPPTTDDGDFTFTILQLNDVYEIAPLEGGRVGGLARVASLLRQLEREDSNTIAIIAGDFLSPSFLGNLKLDNGERIAGLQMIEALNAVGVDYATFGNHEFDLKTAELLEQRMEQSQFRYVCSNAFRAAADMPRPFRQGAREVPHYAVHTFQRGARQYRVALAGVVLPFARPGYVDYLPPLELFQEAAAKAATESDLVLGITHLNFDQDSLLATQLTGVPLLMGGHEHENMLRHVGKTTIAKADANAKTVYVHRFRIAAATGDVSFRSQLVPITAELGEEPTTQAVVDEWQTLADKVMRQDGYDPTQVLMTTEDLLEGTEAAIRNRPTNYGRLTNEALRALLPGADVYLFNSGSLRVDDNLSGDITAFDVLRTFPFGGSIVRMQLPGSELRTLLKIGRYDNRGEGGYLQVLGAEPIDRVDWTVNGKPIDDAQTYAIVLPQFVAEGKESNLDFLSFHKFELPDNLKLGDVAVRNDIRDIVMAYMRSLKR